MTRKQKIIENLEVQVPEIEAIVEAVEIKKTIFKKIGPKKLSLIILVAVAVIGVCGSIYFYNKSKALSVDANAQAVAETQRLVSELGKIMELPKGETPTVATISDKTKLADQTFFADAENGDILFAYTTSMKAILYRPSTHKIINVAPITINQSQDLKQGTNKTTVAPSSDKKP